MSSHKSYSKCELVTTAHRSISMLLKLCIHADVGTIWILKSIVILKIKSVIWSWSSISHYFNDLILKITFLDDLILILKITFFASFDLDLEDHIFGYFDLDLEDHIFWMIWSWSSRSLKSGGFFHLCIQLSIDPWLISGTNATFLEISSLVFTTTSCLNFDLTFLCES